MKARLAVAAAVAGTLTLTGCSKIVEPFNDAPIERKDDSPAVVLSMPDGFSNIAVKCEGPNRVYTIYHGDSPYGAIAVAPNDPRCSS